MPAAATGDTVRVWDDVRNGQHAAFDGGTPPTLAAGGGIEFLIAGGGSLLSSASSPDSSWTMYITAQDLNASDSGVALSDGTGTATTIQPSQVGLATFGVGSVYKTPFADDGSEGCYGMSALAAAVTCFKGATESAQTMANRAVGSLRIGYGSGFPFIGRIRNAALRSLNDDATTRATYRAFLATALPDKDYDHAR